ncbi:transglycosylase family protein [Streptomyces sp. NPDC051684]|uniref:transglycosylase family protein n=1 Tax=Streptomyces sp. NPDC051684 TaxID=3365670 RepID=UPI0037A1B051
MLSGNGRHRRPRQAPALVVAAGVTGSAIAIPLFAASGASAATTQAWDKLAECESGGQWSLDAGNGYYGGLQFTQERWEEYGGLDYAPRADQASRSQQIAVAEKVLGDKGPSAWPMCSLTSDLTKDDGSADVDPGVSASPSAQPSESSDSGDDDKSSGEGADGGADKAGSADATDPADSTESSDSAESAESADSGDKGHDESAGSDSSDRPTADETSDTSGNKGAESSSPSSDKSHAPSDGTPAGTASPSARPSGDTSGRHRGDRADDDGSDSRKGAGRHASRDDKRAGDTYEVHAGDNLWDIAKTQDVHGGWDALYERNKETVGTDPDLILPGQSLDLGDGSDKR